jgi:hypothetical protein
LASAAIVAAATSSTIVAADSAIAVGPPPTTQVLVPTDGATLNGTASVLDASAQGTNPVTGVQFVATGGSISDQVVGTAVPTLYGWIALWNVTTVPNGTYTLQSIATDNQGNTTTSEGVSVTVENTLQSADANYVAAVQKAQSIVAASPYAQNADAANFIQGITNYSLSQALGLTTDQPFMEVDPTPNVRLGFSNPDNLYYTSRVSDQDSYTITGNRGTSTGFLIEALAGIPGDGNTAGAVTSSMLGSQIHYAADGSFSITLSPTQPATGDWMPLNPGTDNLLVRFSFQNWATEQPGSISISKIGGPGNDVADVTPALAATMLNEAATSIPLQAQFYVNQSKQLALLGSNRVVGPTKAQGQQGTDTEQWNVTGNYNINSNQSLIIKIKDAPSSVASYSGIVLNTPLFDSLEFVYHQASLNHAQVWVDPDGYIYYVVSSQDPGVPNWLNDEGQNTGTIFARWQGVASTLGSQYAPVLTVVNTSAVRSALPADMPTVTPTQRVSSQELRTSEILGRFQNADPARPELLRRLRAIEGLLGQNLPEQTLYVPSTPPTASVVSPTDSATIAGGSFLDAVAQSAAGIASVNFELSGGSLSNHVIGAGLPTLFGWIAPLDTTTVPNGSYIVQGVATDNNGNTTTSPGVSVTVNNAPPGTTVVLPASGATVSGSEIFDAAASAGTSGVKYELSGGSLNDSVIATATPTIWGWLANWDTTSVPDGTYTLQSVASYSGGVTGTSPGITISVAN